MQQYKNIFFNTAAEVWTLKMDLEMYCFLTACYIVENIVNMVVKQNIGSSDWNLQGIILQSVQKYVEDNGHHHIVLHERWSEQLSSYCTLKGAAFDACTFDPVKSRRTVWLYDVNGDEFYAAVPVPVVKNRTEFMLPAFDLQIVSQ